MNERFLNITKDIYMLRTPAGGVWSGIILIDGEEKVLIDSGENAEHIDELLVPALKELGIQLQDIAWLCNTHCHGDHVGGHSRIMKLAHPRVASYRKSVPKLQQPLKYSRLIRAVYPSYSPPAPAVLEGVKTDFILEEGDVIAGRLRLVASPGHDDDCVCFYDIPTKTLISGDSLQGNGTRTQGTALYMDLNAYRNTLDKLRKMDIDNIISAHPYLFTNEMALGKQNAGVYLEKCRQITDIYDNYISERLEEGIKNPVQLAEGLITYMGNEMPKWLFLPLYTVNAHIQAGVKDRQGGKRTL